MKTGVKMIHQEFGRYSIYENKQTIQEKPNKNRLKQFVEENLLKELHQISKDEQQIEQRANTFRIQRNKESFFDDEQLKQGLRKFQQNEQRQSKIQADAIKLPQNEDSLKFMLGISEQAPQIFHTRNSLISKQKNRLNFSIKQQTNLYNLDTFNFIDPFQKKPSFQECHNMQNKFYKTSGIFQQFASQKSVVKNISRENMQIQDIIKINEQRLQRIQSSHQNHIEDNNNINISSKQTPINNSFVLKQKKQRSKSCKTETSKVSTQESDGDYNNKMFVQNFNKNLQIMNIGISLKSQLRKQLSKSDFKSLNYHKSRFFVQNV